MPNLKSNVYLSCCIAHQIPVCYNGNDEEMHLRCFNIKWFFFMNRMGFLNEIPAEKKIVIFERKRSSLHVQWETLVLMITKSNWMKRRVFSLLLKLSPLLFMFFFYVSNRVFSHVLLITNFVIDLDRRLFTQMIQIRKHLIPFKK